MSGNVKVRAMRYCLPYPKQGSFHACGVPGRQIDPVVEQHTMTSNRKCGDYGFPDSPISYVSTSSIGEMGVSPNGFREDARSNLTTSEVAGGPAEGVELLLGVAALAEDSWMSKNEQELVEPRKKRGRRPTPGMTAEERRTHR
mmetsp:Transcript_18739/g.75308  ORF Transcript_18739/g.75308 Transcript_18739/m.75308 type:complete len:143 (+) Transcript_18739:368-796(+)